jgi:hypothetical protein
MSFLDPYRTWGRSRATVAAALLSIAVGLLSAPVALYLMVFWVDRMRKDDAVALLIAAFLAGGFFAFAVTFSWLTTVHHENTWHTPVTFLVPYLIVVFLLTLLFTEGFTEYTRPALVAWGLIALGAIAAMLSSFWLIHRGNRKRHAPRS